MSIRQRDSGVILLTLLLFLSVLTVMVGALFTATRHKLELSRAHHDRVCAHYLAELAIKDAMTKLELDPSWVDGFQNKTFPGVKGTYSLTFTNSAARPDQQTSVNNHDGSQPHSYHGDNSVRPGHALLIATARVGTATRTVEAVVNMGGGLYPTDVPLLNDGFVALRGQVTIDGIKSLREGYRVPGGVHSNLDLSGSDLVTLRGSNPRITGKVSSSGPLATAINLGTYSPGQGTETAAAPRPFKRIDILGEIAAHSGPVAPPINPRGTTVLSGNEYYQGSSLNIQGDLELNGVALYVAGDLNVNGSISGDGSIYVGGRTRFYGDSKVTTANPSRVSLYSQGSVEIAGFDGSAYIESAVAGSPVAQDWVQLKQNLRDYQGLANQNGVSLGAGGTQATLDQLANSIGGGGSSALPGQDLTGAIISHIQATLSPGPARRHVLKRLRAIQETFREVNDESPQEDAALRAAENGQVVPGSLDAIVDRGRTDLLGTVRAQANGINFERPGSAYFQGLVYTHGFVHASQEVTVVGALVARQGARGTSPPVKIGNHLLHPGDIYLLDGTDVVYVEDFFKPSVPVSGSRDQGCEVRLWVR